MESPETGSRGVSTSRDVRAATATELPCWGVTNRVAASMYGTLAVSPAAPFATAPLRKSRRKPARRYSRWRPSRRGRNDSWQPACRNCRGRQSPARPRLFPWPHRWPRWPLPSPSSCSEPRRAVNLAGEVAVPAIVVNSRGLPVPGLDHLAQHQLPGPLVQNGGRVHESRIEVVDLDVRDALVDRDGIGGKLAADVFLGEDR